MTDYQTLYLDIY